MRYPLTPDGDCDDVRGVEYDDYQVILSNGIRQTVDIPVHIMPGESSNKCEIIYEREEITVQLEDGTIVSGRENVCVCGTGVRENCPTHYYDFCYGICRKYPRCEFDQLANEPCVCDPDTTAEKFDCGGSNVNVDSYFSTQSTEGWYCVDTANDPTCTRQLPQQIPITQQDTTPLQVTLLTPNPSSQAFNTAKVGATIPIIATIQDDIVSGREKYEIIVRTADNREIKFEGENIGREDIWTIQEQLNTNGFTPGNIFIFIIGRDDSMTSEKARTSSLATVTIEAS